MLIGYMRVSTVDQNTNLQLDSLLKYGVDKRNIYEDKISGSKESRIGLDNLMSFVKSGDTLVVWKLDRLGRSLSHLISIVSRLKEMDVTLVSLTENIDTRTPSGNLIFHIFGSLAEFERNLIKERVLAGLEAAKKRGVKGGRPKVLSNEKFKTMRELINNNHSTASVCRTFGVKRSTFYEAVKRSKDSVFGD